MAKNDCIVTDHSANPEGEIAPADRALTALRYAESMTLVLQSYLASDHAEDCPISREIMDSYCCALFDQISAARAVLTKEVLHG